MPENTPYFEAITAQRSILIRDPEAFVGATISLETQADLARDTVGESLRENFGAFLPHLRHLSPEDQELLTSYFLLGKPQWCLAKIYRSTQTILSLRIRLALKKLGLAAIHGGPPSAQVLDDILEEHELNHILPGATTSRLVTEYRERRSFTLVADALHLHRPDVRRALTKAASVLLADVHEEHTAYGAYIHGLIDKAHVTAVGPSSRHVARHTHMHRVDPEIVGAFRINIDDCAYDSSVWVSRAAG